MTDMNHFLREAQRNRHTVCCVQVTFIAASARVFLRSTARHPPHPVHLKVVVGDVVVVRLHLTESLLVVPHEVVDVQVLPLFYLVNIHLGFGKRGKKSTEGRFVAFRTRMPETACLAFPGGTT